MEAVELSSQCISGLRFTCTSKRALTDSVPTVFVFCTTYSACFIADVQLSVVQDTGTLHESQRR